MTGSYKLNHRINSHVKITFFKNSERLQNSYIPEIENGTVLC